MMPFEAEDGKVEVFDFKARRAYSIKPAINMGTIGAYCRLGPTEFLVGNISDNTYNIITWKEDHPDEFTVREVRPTCKHGHFCMTSKFPKGYLYRMKCSSTNCLSLSRFDHRGRENEINIESMNFKSWRSRLNFDTLISHSAFHQTRQLEFVSFASDGGLRHVQKTFLPPALSAIRSLRIQEIICLQTAAVAVCYFRREKTWKTVLVVLDFKPE